MTKWYDIPKPIKRVFRKANLLKPNYDPEDYDVVSEEEANIITSEISEKGRMLGETPLPFAQAHVMHAPVLDLDIPHRYVPSSTPGHGHLYLDIEVQWNDYVEWLTLSANLGILEGGWVDAAINQGFTAVRKEGIVKTDEERRLKSVSRF
jgi:hypothetical protein